MGAPSFLSLAQLLPASSFELVCDTPKGHKSQYAPSTPPRRRRNRDASPSRSSGSSSSTSSSSSCNTNFINRWDTSHSCSNSPVKPQKPKVEHTMMMMMMPCKTLDDDNNNNNNAYPPPCTLRNVLKPVRRQSVDFCCTTKDGTESLVDVHHNLKTVDFLVNVLDNLTFLQEREDNVIFPTL
uniref:Uncharacterized protein n=1 Tax=Amphora coffeiformis TaxID=265554 RepID=A0A7S3L2R5_9STRA